MRFAIELAAAREILVGRRRVLLGLGDQRQIAEAHALAVAGPVDDQAADAARREIGHAVAVLHLLGDVEAVEEHHRRRGLAAGRLRIGMHQQRRQARALVRNLDRLDARRGCSAAASCERSCTDFA